MVALDDAGASAAHAVAAADGDADDLDEAPATLSRAVDEPALAADGAIAWLTTADADPEAQTPVMRQVLDAKRRHPDCVIFFRLGDFYEMFFEDALLVAPLLDMALTSRNKRDPRPIPMCGFPYAGLEPYLERLLAAGHRVAVVEQLEDPRLVRGIVKRGVQRVITPGVTLESAALDARRDNHLLAVAPGRGDALGVALADVSTGALRVGELAHAAALDALLARCEVREVLAAQGLAGRLQGVLGMRGLLCTERAPEPGGRGGPADPAAAAVALLRSYLAELRPGALGLLSLPRPLAALPHLQLSRETVQHLELICSARTGARAGSLLAVLDLCQTPAGSRQLRALLLAPLADAAAIAARHDAVEALWLASEARAALRAGLAAVADLERVAGRVCAGLASPRELARARDTLAALPALAAAVAPLCARAPRLGELVGAFAGCEGPLAELQRSLDDEPRNALADGGVIRPGRDAALDEARLLLTDADAWADAYQERLRAELGLAGLKLRHNRLTGWGIEISRARGDQVPPQLRRLQTLKHVERYATAELADFQDRLQHAEADRLSRETALWQELCTALAGEADALRRAGAALAELDLHAAFAEVAARAGYVRPALAVDGPLQLVAARHPVVEQALPRGAFVANDVALDPAGVRVLLLTGPNMAGKSTLMRQVALAAICAQAGGFVAASAATLPIFDALMTRIGAADDIAGGASTFMVEMRETAAILAHAGPRSLVLLDEVGRGTSTDDGTAIAQAVVEHLHDATRALVLFATHYHELTALEGALRHLANAHVAVREIGDDVVFVHTLQPGPTSRSHGLSVARLAGLPAPVLRRAREVLDALLLAPLGESSGPRGGGDAGRGRPPSRRAAAAAAQLGLFQPPTPAAPAAPSSPDDPRLRALLRQLAALDPDELSPRQAHALLADLAALARAVAADAGSAGGS